MERRRGPPATALPGHDRTCCRPGTLARSPRIEDFVPVTLMSYVPIPSALSTEVDRRRPCLVIGVCSVIQEHLFIRRSYVNAYTCHQPGHCLHHLLPPKTSSYCPHRLRKRQRPYQLPTIEFSQHKNRFINRCLFKIRQTVTLVILTGWASKNETILVRPTSATVQNKIKWISLKCSESLRE